MLVDIYNQWLCVWLWPTIEPLAVVRQIHGDPTQVYKSLLSCVLYWYMNSLTEAVEVIETIEVYRVFP